MGDNISLEPLFNDAKPDGSGGYVTAINEVGAMSHRTALTINATAQLITIAANKTHMEIQNTGSEDIYLGGSGVDSAKGQKLFPDYLKAFNKVKTTFSFYAVCASGKTSTLRITEYS